MPTYLVITVASVIAAAVAAQGWRKARREVIDLRLMYWTALDCLRETTSKDAT
jgi:Flp pilus assembly protein TadB